MFKKILCALDGSEHARKAAAVACDLAAKNGAEVTFLTVTKKVQLNDQVRRYMALENITGEPQYVLDIMTQEIMAHAKAMAKDSGLAKVTADIQEGKPARTIVSRAKRDGSDLIVMGRRGLGDVEGALLGSVSHKVANLADCTVMTVR